MYFVTVHSIEVRKCVFMLNLGLVDLAAKVLEMAENENERCG
jgi:hypothetical protein